MFRIASQLSAARLSLLKPKRVSGQDIPIAWISRGLPVLKYQKPRERDPCPPKPQPQPPRKSTRLFWSVVSMLVATGCFAVYARDHPELRDWISINAPWFDDLIAAVHQENVSYIELGKKLTEDIKKAMIAYFKADKPKGCSSDGIPLQTVELPECENDEDEEDEEDEEGDYVIVKLKEEYDHGESPCCQLPPPVLTKDVCEIERCLKDLGDTVIINYMTARDACIYYNKLVTDTMANYTVQGINEVREAMAERLALVKESLARVNAADSKLDDLTRYLDCGVKAPKEAIQNTKDLMKEICEKIKTNKLQFIWENDKSLAIDELWQSVEELLLKYKDENQLMFCGLKYESLKPSLKGDPDLLIYHTLRYVEKLKKELADAVAGMTDRVNRGVESLPQGAPQKAMRASNIASLYAKKKAELDADYRRRTNDQKTTNERILKESLKKQLEKHEENLKAKLIQREQEASKKLNKAVAEQVATEKKMLAKQLADMAAMVKKVEDKLNAKLHAERQTRRSQELWTAGASLLAATKKGDPYVRVDRELRAIEKASGDGDKLVETVLKAIPKSVREKGIVPESVLRQKYQVIRGIPQNEFEKIPKEPYPDLDTFDLLQRARFWMERGNIAAALGYINSLQGASMAAATAWRDAARDHLETRQAAEAVIAHAAALGLQYI